MIKNQLQILFVANLLFYLFLPNISNAQSPDSHFENAEAFQQGFSGLVVKDLETDEIVYERLGDKYFTPASNVKLLTFYAGLKILEDSVPGLKYWTNNDSLIFTGTGDPSFLNPELPQSDILAFLKNRKEKLFYLPASKIEKHYGPGWAWDDYNSSYSPERSDFPIYGNLVSFGAVSSRRVPVVYPRVFQDSIVLKNFYGQRSGIERDLYKNYFTYYYVPVLPRQSASRLPFRYSPELLVKLLSDVVEKEIKILNTLPPKAGEPQIKMSVPTDSLYKRMLQDSDNFIAEQILLLSSNKLKNTFDADIAIDHILKKTLKDLPDKIYWVDGSGLSRYNLMTPRSMVALLDKIADEVETERLFHLLATYGKTGTIRNYYHARQPYIFAKTGTLLHNHSMSGYLKSKSGKILAFSFMNSNFVVPTREIKREMEKILRDIYNRY
ncbi:D-alanyl-D-alanine carboxypeptidase [Antarcticibacterium sp. 1MA-6-2]|uniref:D-alanyl-D-alanine carboxypeptidase/D-alanyl-D-alanine-endopeptidase n=1 Tax=Antarcticibacterium sp. 1MA-6-2 TaxID=2908210 RepID=UPI001F1A4AD1|nr:D-alanyl-D-alanine carboxypeptidase [Antarcticibacterium sp. 1MA-6-2]UJH89703.1 D-alanyl-D-alanine carboxypeptidase [Antarcticibacterium sp. 1MA-6-2]